MERLILRTARRHTLGKLAWCTVGLGIGAVLVNVRLSAWIGWAVLLIAAIPALLLLRSLGEDTERIVIDDAGIRDSQFPVGVIGWSDIKAATVETVAGTKVVSLELRDPERVIRRLPPPRQFISRKAREAGLPSVYLGLRGIDADPGQIAELINRRAREVARW
jgi:hypothetical protein